jgi:hypothetical protein
MERKISQEDHASSVVEASLLPLENIHRKSSLLPHREKKKTERVEKKVTFTAETAMWVEPILTPESMVIFFILVLWDDNTNH